MELENLRTNQLSDAGWTAYRRYLTVLDDYDIDGFAAFLSDDISVQFNNDDPMTGKDTVVAGLGGFWASIRDMGYSLVHEPINIYGTDERYVLEALNHYDHADRDRITVRAVAFTDKNPDGAVTSIRIYQDLSPLYAPA
ncbi:MAG: nuclear transport factor 2 family protein [Actinomycetota bacterium]